MQDSQLSPRATIAIVIILVIGVLIAATFVYTSRPDPVSIIINPPLPTATMAPTATPEPITVYVTGAVNMPQVTLTLPHDSRVSDVIAAAGGMTDDADLDLINLAGIVRDGDQIHVPSLNDSDESADGLPTPSGGDLIYINTATLEELTTLPGIGAVTAQAIIDYRTENGAFTSLDDLDNVSGIGPTTLENLTEFISFE